MRARICAFITFLLLLPCAINSQQVTTASTQPSAAAILSQSLAAMSGSASVSDITLTGAAERIAGSDNETGTVTYRAVPNANRIDLSLSGGSRTEIRATKANGPGGKWIGPDGAVHEISQHNLMTEVGWFPIYTLTNLVSVTNAVLTYVGPENKNGVSVIHLRAAQQLPSASASEAALLQHLTQLDLYLDASSFLPVALDFNTHPDDNEILDIPVELLFSDYQKTGSLTIPLHVQEFLNGSLFLDLQFQQASLNSGLSSSSTIFAIQ